MPKSLTIRPFHSNCNKESERLSIKFYKLKIPLGAKMTIFYPKPPLGEAIILQRADNPFYQKATVAAADGCKAAVDAKKYLSKVLLE